MKKILITGSLGFIYSNFVRRLVYEKHKFHIFSVDKVADPNDVNNIYYNKNHEFWLGDVSNAETMDRLFSFIRPDIVVHTAAETSVDDSIIFPEKFIQANILGTQTVVDMCLKYKVEKNIFISTDEVYGALNSDSEASWTESSPLDPRNPYSVSKCSAEMLVRAAHNARGLNYIIVRPSNTYGKRQKPSKLIPRVIQCVLNNEEIPVYGTGSQIRDWLFVDDHAAGIITLLYSNVNNEIFNLAGGQEYANIEVIQQVCNNIGYGHNLIKFITDPRGKAHDFRYSCDSSKLKAQGWRPQVKFKDGIKETVGWYLNNKYYLI